MSAQPGWHHRTPGSTLGARMRLLLIACGPMNLAGAVCFSPPCPWVRQWLGLAEPAPFYLWLISAWILGFGLAFFHQGWTGRANLGVLALAAWGKLAFASLLIHLTLTNEATPLAGWAALPDLLLALVFVWFIRQSLGQSPNP